MKRTTDHETIRLWAEARGGRPSVVRGTAQAGDPGILRIKFDEPTRREVSWELWFQKFERRCLELLYEEDTPDGHESHFARLVSRRTDRVGRLSLNRFRRGHRG